MASEQGIDAGSSAEATRLQSSTQDTAAQAQTKGARLGIVEIRFKEKCSRENGKRRVGIVASLAGL